MNKILAVCLMVASMLTLTSCKKVVEEKIIEPTAYEKIQKTLVNMQTYEAQASVEYVSNKNSSVYETLQQCKTTGEYRVEVTGPEKAAGNITLSDGSIICQYNKRHNGKISIGTKENQDRSEIFLTSFLKNYLHSQEVSVSVSNFGTGKCTVLEAVIPGNHPYLSTEKLWVDNETQKPVKLVVYDPEGGERIIVTYNSFEYNVELDDTLFDTGAKFGK